MILVDQAMAELQEQGEMVFGNPEATDEKEKKGELNEHIGENFEKGELKEGESLAGFNLDSKKTDLLEHPDAYKELISNGNGQIQQILLDVQYNEMRKNLGLAELSKPAWDKKMWTDKVLFLEPPTLRGVVDVAMNVVANTMVPGVGSVLMGLADDAVFGMLDLSKGYTNITDLGNQLGKKALTMAAGKGIGALGEWAGNGFASAMTDSSALWNGVVQGAVSATTTFATSVANNYVGAVNIMDIGTAD